MVGASVYIIVCSARNRALRWVGRLREPRYLVAVIAGAAYLYFVIRMQNRRGRASRGQSRAVLDMFSTLASAGPSIVGFAALAVAAGSWIFPGTGALLEFSRSEVQFLFPAPVSRRQLIVHRMMRSQLGLLFGPLVFAILLPLGSTAERIRMAVTLWLVLFTARVYFSGVALARARLASSDPRRRLLARLPMLLVAGALASVVVAVGRTLLAGTFVDISEVFVRMVEVVNQGLPRIALWPFVTLVRPMFASGWPEFLSFLAGALLVAAAPLAWLLLNDEIFEDVTRDVADQQKDQPLKKKTSYRRRQAWWKLAPVGRAEGAFAWKGALQTLRIVEIRIFVRMALFVIWMGVVASIASRGASATIGVFAIIGVGMSTFIGPLILRIDLRQDLQHLELLKTWPIRASALVRGEMLWPGVVLASVVWMMTALALYLSTAVFSEASLILRISAAAAVCLVAPALIAVQLTIHNAAALVFPAWVAFGNWRARGVDAVGQRLIVVGLTTLLLALAAAPGAIAGAIVWFAFNQFIGPAALIPAGAACAAVIGLEVLVTTEALGPAYERLDLTSVERAE